MPADQKGPGRPRPFLSRYGIRSPDAAFGAKAKAKCSTIGHTSRDPRLRFGSPFSMFSDQSWPPTRPGPNSEGVNAIQDKFRACLVSYRWAQFSRRLRCSKLTNDRNSLRGHCPVSAESGSAPRIPSGGIYAFNCGVRIGQQSRFQIARSLGVQRYIRYATQAVGRRLPMARVQS